MIIRNNLLEMRLKSKQDWNSTHSEASTSIIQTPGVCKVPSHTANHYRKKVMPPASAKPSPCRQYLTTMQSYEMDKTAMSIGSITGKPQSGDTRISKENSRQFEKPRKSGHDVALTAQLLGNKQRTWMILVV